MGSRASTYASDVYSFGMVAWEVLARQVPWSGETSVQDIVMRVLRGERPAIPRDGAADIIEAITASWVGAPEKRPQFSEMLKSVRIHGWDDK